LEIPLYLVTATFLSKRETSFVPPEERCIIVNAQSLFRLSELFATSEPNAREVNGELALALILLHEVVHIVNGDSGSFFGSEAFDLKDLNVATSDQKNRELKADQFAAEQIQTAANSSVPRRIAMGVRIQMVLNAAAWNQAMERAGADLSFSQEKPESFLDKGFSHPNLELRLLVMSYQINKSDLNLGLIKTFLAKRQQATSSK
jgi:hypothetical protein